MTGPTQRAFIARKLALGTSAVVGIAANTANIVIGHIPAPRGDGIPFSYRDFHRAAVRACCDDRYVSTREMRDGKQTRLVLAGRLMAVNKAAAATPKSIRV